MKNKTIGVVAPSFGATISPYKERLDKAISVFKELGYHIASYDILDIYRGNIDYFIFDYHNVKKEAIDDVIELCNKYNVTCILFGIDTKEDIDMARTKGYHYIFGNYYKKQIRMKDILKNIKRK